MKCMILCALVAIALAEGELSCLNTANEATTCETGVTKCSGPILSITGWSATDQACGECASGTEATCKDCDTADCNTKEATTFECYDYTWVVTDDVGAWTKATAASTCYSISDNNQCNSPAEGVAEADWTSSNGGCGACADSADTNCVSTSGAPVAVLSTLISLIAAFYALM